MNLFCRIRKDMSALLCPIDNHPIAPDGPTLYFKLCESTDGFTKSALQMSSMDLLPFTNTYDITSVDYDDRFPLDNKLKKIAAEKTTATTAKPKARTIFG